jgi:hypothetical protein
MTCTCQIGTSSYVKPERRWCGQVNYDLLDTYPGGPYKSRGGSIKKTRYPVEEEEDEENEEGAVRRAAPRSCLEFC